MFSLLGRSVQRISDRFSGFLLCLLILMIADLASTFLLSGTAKDQISPELVVSAVLGLLLNLWVMTSWLMYAGVSESGDSITFYLQHSLGKFSRVALFAFSVYAIILLGTALFVIPGLIFAVVLYFWLPLVVFENRGLSDTCQRSIELVKKNLFLVLILIGFLDLPLLAMELGANLPKVESNLPLRIILSLVHSGLSLFSILVLANVYFQVRTREVVSG